MEAKQGAISAVCVQLAQGCCEAGSATLLRATYDFHPQCTTGQLQRHYMKVTSVLRIATTQMTTVLCTAAGNRGDVDAVRNGNSTSR